MAVLRPSVHDHPRHAVTPARIRRQAEAVYARARGEATAISTVRLRFAERRARASVGRLDLFDRARLAAIRDELRFRGMELPDL
jgi:hypothetical protein